MNFNIKKHPFVQTGDANILKRRAGSIEIKNACALLRRIYMEGTDIIGEIETLSGFKGPDLASIVMYDKVNIGFSLRALGAVDQRPDGTIVVLEPIKPIKYYYVMGLYNL